MVQGEVLEVDRDFAKVIIKHHALVGLGMPAMTMAFSVPDTAVLDSLQAGAHIKFLAQIAPHGLAIAKIELVRD
ncbi:copper-binding protein [Herbaspirillum aquaticum]|nr:copper-binding protein [Herbaspirillum aquaticum]